MKQSAISLSGSLKLVVQMTVLIAVLTLVLLRFLVFDNEFIKLIKDDFGPNTLDHNNAYGDSTVKKSPVLLLFTTAYKSTEKNPVTKLILQLWNSWRPAIQPLVFTSDERMKEDATLHGWPSLPEGAKNPSCLGPPLFPNTFLDAMNNINATFYGFSNTDMVYDDGLLLTIKALFENKTLLSKPLMISGTRTDLDFQKYRQLLRTTEDVESLAPFGEERRYAMDYWISTRSFPWNDVLPLTIGKTLFGRWILAFAMEHKDIILIDTSKTIKSLHLTTTDGNFSSWVKPGNDCNVNIVRYVSPKVNLMQLGRPACAEIETYWDEGVVRIRERKPSETLCKAYYNPNMKQTWMNYWDDPNHKKKLM